MTTGVAENSRLDRIAGEGQTLGSLVSIMKSIPAHFASPSSSVSARRLNFLTAALDIPKGNEAGCVARLAAPW
jgi:hypothetical protein